MYAELASAMRGGSLIITGPQADALVPTVEALLTEAKAEWVAEALSAVERACLDATHHDSYDRIPHWDDSDHLASGKVCRRCDSARDAIRAALGEAE